MILSNEPGYYKANAFGIRIENLELVVEKTIAGAEKPMNGCESRTLAPIDRRLINANRIRKQELAWINAFETLTLAPIDRRLIDLNMLTGDELSWLNDYHARVRHEIRPLLDDATKEWLDAATEPLSL